MPYMIWLLQLLLLYLWQLTPLLALIQTQCFSVFYILPFLLTLLSLFPVPVVWFTLTENQDLRSCFTLSERIYLNHLTDIKTSYIWWADSLLLGYNVRSARTCIWNQHLQCIASISYHKQWNFPQWNYCKFLNFSRRRTKQFGQENRYLFYSFKAHLHQIK
jgi:hypothetical protein